MTVLIPDGVGVRNFVLGPFLRSMARVADVDVLHSIPPESLPSIRDDAGADGHWEPLRPYHDGPFIFVLRNALAYAHMFQADTHFMRYELRRRPRGSARVRAARYAARSVGWAASSRSGMRFLSSWHWSLATRKATAQAYRARFEERRPTVVFSSHQTPLDVLPPVLAARRLGIPTATFIFSWDNITTKGYITAPFDHYLVWSEHMRAELLRYYPTIRPEHVHIVGTPQFDPYADARLLVSRDAFFRQVGADGGRKLICYSGGDAGTCPEDQHHVALLMRLIRSGRIAGDPQVLLRPAPVDDGSRYAEVRREFPELIFAAPDWLHAGGRWSQVIPTPADIRFLANLTLHSDLNVNVASTMTMDFAIRDRPIVNIAFDVASPPPFGVELWRHYYEFEHYRPVVELGAARFARSADELAMHVNAYLDDPTLDRENRRRLLELEVGAPIGTASQRIVDVLSSIGG
jgi:hypothetical protein